MNTRNLLPILALGVAGALGTGCAHTPTGDGAVVGGALGAGLGAIIGNQTGDAGEGALIGAAAGALSGGLIGNAIERQARRPYYAPAPVVVERPVVNRPAPKRPAGH